MAFDKIIGLDPGAKGGLALLDVHTLKLDSFKMPDTPEELWKLINGLTILYSGNIIAYLEKLKANAFTKASWGMGLSTGHLQMALAGNGIRREEVRPNQWQRGINCQTGGDKKISKAAALKLFPDHKVTNYTADAILIAEYGRRIEASFTQKEAS